MTVDFQILLLLDHCRIGSLEILPEDGGSEVLDHCRIGSLENTWTDLIETVKDHCRIGSLEIPVRSH